MRGDPVVVVGGGASGTLAALALRHRDHPVLLVSDADPGPGLAYRTPEPYHLLNSRAAGMSAHPTHPTHFTDWLTGPASPASPSGPAIPAIPADPASPSGPAGPAGPVSAAGPAVFPARRRYGAYLVDTLNRAAAGGGIEHLPGRAVAVHPVAGGALVELAGGRSVRAAAVVLATGHTPPPVPAVATQLAGLTGPTGSTGPTDLAGSTGSAGLPVAAGGRYVNDPWSPGALAATGYAGPVLLIGTGLTAIDVAMTIHRHNPDAVIHAVSRHGLLPTRHTDTVPEPWPFHAAAPASWPAGSAAPTSWPVGSGAPTSWPFDRAAAPGGSAPPARCPESDVIPPLAAVPVEEGESWPATTRELLRMVRRSLDAAAAAGRDWRCVVDGLRLRADGLWEALPVVERRRFVRHLDRYWQVCRHRMAPPVGRAVDTMLAAGTLRPVAGRLVGLTAAGGGIRAEVRTRHGGDLTLHCGAVVNCTGPGSPATGPDPLAESLRGAGLARLNPLATGFDCDPAGALVGAGGRVSGLLWAVGPIRRGASWETTAVPEIRAQAATVAAALATAADRLPDRLPGAAAPVPA